MNTFLSFSTPLLVLMLAGVGWLYRNEKEKKDQIEKQLTDKKFAVYSNIIDVMIGAISAQHDGKHLSQRKLTNSLRDAQKQLLMYGSDSVLSSYVKFMKDCFKGDFDLAVMVDNYSSLLLEIRRDMGNFGTKISTHDIMRMMISDYDEVVLTSQKSEQ